MKSFLLLCGVLVFGFLAYTSYQSFNAEDSYIEACLYFSEQRSQKQGCYDVYPETHKRDAVIQGGVSAMLALVFGGAYLLKLIDGEEK